MLLWLLFCQLIQGLSGADGSVTHTTEELQKAFQVLFGRISSQEPINLLHSVSLKISCHSHADDDEIIINVNCKLMLTSHVSIVSQHNRLFPWLSHMVQNLLCWMANDAVRYCKINICLWMADTSINYIFYVPLCNFPSSLVDFVPRDQDMQRAHWLVLEWTLWNSWKNRAKWWAFFTASLR